MVRSINEIGHLTGKQTIAEFAESPEIINMLRQIGVDHAQGYGVSAAAACPQGRWQRLAQRTGSLLRIEGCVLPGQRHPVSGSAR